jgi:hypothetical protein
MQYIQDGKGYLQSVNTILSFPIDNYYTSRKMISAYPG